MSRLCYQPVAPPLERARTLCLGGSPCPCNAPPPPCRGSDEHQLVELSDGTVLANSRALSTGSPQQRVQAFAGVHNGGPPIRATQSSALGDLDCGWDLPLSCDAMGACNANVGQRPTSCSARVDQLIAGRILMRMRWITSSLDAMGAFPLSGSGRMRNLG